MLGSQLYLDRSVSRKAGQGLQVRHTLCLLSLEAAGLTEEALHSASHDTLAFLRTKPLSRAEVKSVPSRG